MLAGFPPFYDDNPFLIYQRVLAARMDFPFHIDRDAKVRGLASAVVPSLSDPEASNRVRPAVDGGRLSLLPVDSTRGIARFPNPTLLTIWDAAECNLPCAQDLIQQLCHPDGGQRLGCTVAGPAAIRSHPFLKPIDWTGLTAGAAVLTVDLRQHSVA